MYDIQKRKLLTSGKVKELIEALSALPSDASVSCCGADLWLHVEKYSSAVCIDCDSLDDCYDLDSFPACPVCGNPITFGCMYDEGTLVHEECFKEYMDKKYGEWRQCEDDGADGYYQFKVDGEWRGTGIYYTEFEENELKEMGRDM